MIQAILGIQHVHHTFLDRLDHYNSPVKVRLPVEVPYYPVYKSPEEISFPELDYLFRILPCIRSRSVELFHSTIYYWISINFEVG